LHVGPKEAVHGGLEHDPVAFFAFTHILAKKNIFIRVHRFSPLSFVLLSMASGRSPFLREQVTLRYTKTITKYRSTLYDI
jgi:hypothetical protein